MDPKQNPYDFILNSQNKPQRNLNFGNSTKARVILVVGSLVLLLILYFVVSSFLNKDQNAQQQRLIEVAQAQTELIRVSEFADERGQALNTRSIGIATRLSIASQQQEVKSVLSKGGIKEKSLSKKLKTAQNDKTDAALDEAETNGRFDDTFLDILAAELENYEKLLKNARGGAGPDEQKILTLAIAQVDILQSKNKITPKPTDTIEKTNPEN